MGDLIISIADGVPERGWLVCFAMAIPLREIPVRGQCAEDRQAVRSAGGII